MSDAKDKRAEHSPAPWRVDADGFVVVDAAGCLVIETPTGDDECRANARLIAAAPALLKALRAMVKAGDDMMVGIVGTPIVAVEGSPLDDARKALALVDGDG